MYRNRNRCFKLENLMGVLNYLKYLLIFWYDINFKWLNRVSMKILVIIYTVNNICPVYFNKKIKICNFNIAN